VTVRERKLMWWNSTTDRTVGMGEEHFFMPYEDV